MTTLDVYLHDEFAGRLVSVGKGQVVFTYDSDWVSSGGQALSYSLPVRPGAFHDAEARPFFAGLLPEGEFLKAVARSFGVSAGNAFSLLDEIGGECAGAVSLVTANSHLPGPAPPLWLESAELARLLEDLPSNPLTLNLEDRRVGLRLSLAGAQDKLPVMFESGKIGITGGEPPSSHIIKLPPDGFDDIVANEAYCLSLARNAGLDVVDAKPWMLRAASLDGPPKAEFLLVERYDRAPSGSGPGRLHQEDFCQALGVIPEIKYQAEGGPGVAGAARLLRNASAAPAVDILAFGDAIIFNWIVGNNDAHGKNFSLLMDGGRSPRLAPLYDLVSTMVYPSLDRKMAMRLGGEARPDYIESRHIDRLASDLEVGGSFFRRRVARLCHRVSRETRKTADSMDPEFAISPVVPKIIEHVDRGIIRALRAVGE